MTTERNILDETADAYAELQRDPERWQEELDERAEWDVTLADGLEDESVTIKTGDTVLHRPSGETWLVATVDEAHNRLSWCGWPEGYAELSDCELVTSCTAEQQVNLLMEMAGMRGNDHRKRYARQKLSELVKQEHTT